VGLDWISRHGPEKVMFIYTDGYQLLLCIRTSYIKYKQTSTESEIKGSKMLGIIWSEFISMKPRTSSPLSGRSVLIASTGLKLNQQTTKRAPETTKVPVNRQNKT
jgi:hypothetical protein